MHLITFLIKPNPLQVQSVGILRSTTSRV